MNEGHLVKENRTIRHYKDPADIRKFHGFYFHPLVAQGVKKLAADAGLSASRYVELILISKMNEAAELELTSSQS